MTRALGAAASVQVLADQHGKDTEYAKVFDTLLPSMAALVGVAQKRCDEVEVRGLLEAETRENEIAAAARKRVVEDAQRKRDDAAAKEEALRAEETAIEAEQAALAEREREAKRRRREVAEEQRLAAATDPDVDERVVQASAAANKASDKRRRAEEAIRKRRRESGETPRSVFHSRTAASASVLCITAVHFVCVCVCLPPFVLFSPPLPPLLRTRSKLCSLFRHFLRMCRLHASTKPIFAAVPFFVQTVADARSHFPAPGTVRTRLVRNVDRVHSSGSSKY